MDEVSSHSRYLITEITLEYGDIYQSFVTNDGILLIGRRDNGKILVIDPKNQSKKSIYVRPLWTKLSVSRDGTKIAMITPTSSIEIWDVKECLDGNTKPMYSMDPIAGSRMLLMSQDWKKFISHVDGRHVYVHDVEKNRLICRTDEKLETGAWLITPLESDRIVCVSELGPPDLVQIFDLSTGKSILSRRFPFSVWKMTPIPDNNELLIASKTDVYIWDMTSDTMTHRMSFTLLDQNVNVLQITKRKIICASKSHIEVYEPEYSHIPVCIKSMQDHTIRSSGCTSDGKIVMTYDGCVRLYSIDTHPFWTMKNFATFRGNLRKTMYYLSMIKLVPPQDKKRKRSRQVFREIPREILWHIFSFLRREEKLI